MQKWPALLISPPHKGQRMSPIFQSAHAFSERLLRASQWWPPRGASWLSNTSTAEEMEETGPSLDGEPMGGEL